MMMRLRRATQREWAVLHKARALWVPYALPGGLPARHRKRPSQFDQDQLAIGAAVELEHTNNPALAMEIAMGHLIEDRAYYAKLESLRI